MLVGLDRNKNGRLDYEEFMAEAKQLGYTGNTKKLFNYFLLDQGRQYLTLEDIDPVAMVNLYSGHEDVLYQKKPNADEIKKMNFYERQDQSMQSRLGTLIFNIFCNNFKFTKCISIILTPSMGLL
jgi:hypothetical protein